MPKKYNGICKYLIIRGGIALSSVSISMFTFYQLLESFWGNDLFPKLLMPWKFVIFILAVLIIVSIYLLVLLLVRYYELSRYLIKDNMNVSDSLILILEDAYNNKRWTEVVKIGRQLSEPLWYTGKFSIRVKIGEMLEAAAALCNELDIQAETLIDDLGWTNFRLGKSKIAYNNIKRGLSIAISQNNYYLMAKAYRHFADIEMQRRNFPESLKFYDIASSFLGHINDDIKRAEMGGNLNYTLAKYHMLKGEHSLALEKINESQRLYQTIKDLDREVKLYNWKGKILLALSRDDEAVKAFQDGLLLATQISNNVHIVSNDMGLAECYINEGRLDLAEKMVELAVKSSSSMNDPILLKNISELKYLLKLKRESA